MKNLSMAGVEKSKTYPSDILKIESMNRISVDLKFATPVLFFQVAETINDTQIMQKGYLSKRLSIW
jgi:hypothetical protein